MDCGAGSYLAYALSVVVPFRAFCLLSGEPVREMSKDVSLSALNCDEIVLTSCKINVSDCLGRVRAPPLREQHPDESSHRRILLRSSCVEFPLYRGPKSPAIVGDFGLWPPCRPFPASRSLANAGGAWRGDGLPNAPAFSPSDSASLLSLNSFFCAVLPHRLNKLN